MTYVVCSDFESVLIPETWISIAEKTGIKDLKLTTRDISDFDELMQKRLSIINENNFTISDLQKYIDNELPYDGSTEFVSWIQNKTEFNIVSGIFEEFAKPFLAKLGTPKLYCNNFKIDNEGKITGYLINKSSNKKEVVKSLKNKGLKVIAFGDSYNDLEMINTADVGFLFNPSEKIQKEYPEIPVARNFKEAKEILSKYI
jgi:phosphoserine / homoserine phosphotransferase